LIQHLGQVKNVEWQIFSKRHKEPYREGNIQIFPVNNETFNKSMASCEGLLTGGGFEGPAEALYLKKKVMMIPMMGQYEQQCNALAASKLGVPVVHAIDDNFVGHLNKWINDDQKVEVDFPDDTAKIVDNMIKRYAKPGSILA
jgi:uncharacterized protein (TIGR00661 family)